MAPFFHILLPVVFTIVTAIVAASEAIIVLPFYMFVGGIYICAPHICWLGIHLLAKPSPAVIHAGYIAATSAMFIIGGVFYLPPEGSVLPFLWVAYWPLAGILIVLSAGIASLFQNA